MIHLQCPVCKAIQSITADQVEEILTCLCCGKQITCSPGALPEPTLPSTSQASGDTISTITAEVVPEVPQPRTRWPDSLPQPPARPPDPLPEYVPRPFRIHCPVCSATFEVNSTLIGRQAICARCRHQFPIETPPQLAHYPGEPVRSVVRQEQASRTSPLEEAGGWRRGAVGLGLIAGALLAGLLVLLAAGDAALGQPHPKTLPLLGVGALAGGALLLVGHSLLCSTTSSNYLHHWALGALVSLILLGLAIGGMIIARIPQQQIIPQPGGLQSSLWCMGLGSILYLVCYLGFLLAVGRALQKPGLVLLAVGLGLLFVFEGVLSLRPPPQPGKADLSATLGLGVAMATFIGLFVLSVLAAAAMWGQARQLTQKANHDRGWGKSARWDD